MKYHLLFLIAFLNSIFNLAQNDTISAGSKLQVAKGMKQHDFLYADEWHNSSFKDQQMFIVKDAKIAWSYTMSWEGEIVMQHCFQTVIFFSHVFMAQVK